MVPGAAVPPKPKSASGPLPEPSGPVVGTPKKDVPPTVSTGRSHMVLRVNQEKAGAFGIERTFAWLLNSRRHRCDYEVLTANSEAMIQISMIHLLLKRLP